MEIDELSVAYGAEARRQRGLAAGPPGRGAGADRPLRLRQDDAAALAQPAHRADPHGVAARAASRSTASTSRRSSRPAAAPGDDGLPAAEPVPDERVRQHRLRPARAGLAAGAQERRSQPAVHSALDRAGLFEEVKDNLDHPALKLSGGQQQRLCIARALAAEPEVLLLDEPCSALDPQSTQVIEDLIVKLRDDVAVVIVTHNLQQAYRVADYVAFMYLGDLVEYGSATDALRLARASNGPRSTSAVPSASADRPIAVARRLRAARRRALAGCDTTQDKARAPEGPLDARRSPAASRRDRQAGATATCACGRVDRPRQGTAAIAVTLRNVGSAPVNDLPLAVGRADGGRRAPRPHQRGEGAPTSRPMPRRSPPGERTTWVYHHQDDARGRRSGLRRGRGRAPTRRHDRQRACRELDVEDSVGATAKPRQGRGDRRERRPGSSQYDLAVYALGQLAPHGLAGDVAAGPDGAAST